MTFTEDVAADATIADGAETVAITQNRAGQSRKIGGIASVLRRQLSRRDILALGTSRIESNDRVYNVPTISLDASPFLFDSEMHASDKIETADGEYIVLSADLQTLGARWRCVCRKLLPEE